MSDSRHVTVGSTIKAGNNPKRWRALAVLALVQFILVVDISIVNVALPSIKNDLGFSQAGLAWIVSGYALTAGGLLLLGGRLADILGRRRVFLFGLGLFALASLTCGLALNPPMLVTSRFMQGAGEAFASPAALGLVALLFPDRKERMKALGIWGGMAGLGGTTGTLISGVLTGLASWRWIFLVNLPIAAFALIVVPRLVSESRMDRAHDAGRRVDVWGAVTATAGLVAIVYGLLQAATDPWGSAAVLLPLTAGIGLLGLFVVTETRVAAPLIPLRFFTNRTRVVANIVTLLFASAVFAYFFLLTLFMQQVLRFTPLPAGLAYLPFGLTTGAGIAVSTTLMPRFGVKPLLAVGFLGSAAGLLLTSGVTPTSSYAAGVLPGMLLMGFFSGVGFPAIINAALHKVTGQDASLASGVQSAVSQVGGAIGLSCLVAFALQHAADLTRHGDAAALSSTNGYALAFRIGATLLVFGSVLVFLFIQRSPGSAAPLETAVDHEPSLVPVVESPGR